MNNLLPHHFASALLKQVWPQRQMRELLFATMIDSPKTTTPRNASNRGKQSKNTSGTVGVFWNKACKKWQAQIEVRQKNIHLGLFSSKPDACAARKAAEIRYFGSFSYDASQQLSILKS